MFYRRNRSTDDSYFISKARRFSDHCTVTKSAHHLHEDLIQKCPRFNSSTHKYHGFSEVCVHKSSRNPIEERVMFERLWRGALCQAFGSRVPIKHRKVCCCHCQCDCFEPCNVQRPKKTMRSVIR